MFCLRARIQITWHLTCSFLLLSRCIGWSCPRGQCSIRTQAAWAPSSFECVLKPEEEFAVRLVPYHGNYLERFENYSEYYISWEPKATPIGIGSLFPAANFSNSASQSEGLVQVYRNGAWRKICLGPGYDSDDSMARVQTCRQLGYSYYSYLVYNPYRTHLCEQGAARQMSGVVVGKCLEGERIGQCTKQWNYNTISTVCSESEPAPCQGEVSIRCSNYQCLDSNINTYFPFHSWRNSTWLANAVLLFETHMHHAYYISVEQFHCECMLACLVAGASACGVNCIGCYAGSGTMSIDEDFICYGADPLKRFRTMARNISAVDAAMDWNSPESQPNATLMRSIPEPCLLSTLVVHFTGAAIFLVPAEDGPMRYIVQHILDCFFLNRARIILTDASIADSEWRVDFFFAAAESAAQSEILMLLETFAVNSSFANAKLPACLDQIIDKTLNPNVKLGLLIFKANVKQELVEFIFDDRSSGRGTNTTTTADANANFPTTHTENIIANTESTTGSEETSHARGLASLLGQLIYAMIASFS